MAKRIFTDAEETLLDTFEFDRPLSSLTTSEWKVNKINSVSVDKQPNWISVDVVQDPNDSSKTKISVFIRPFIAKQRQNVTDFIFVVDLQSDDGSTFFKESSVTLQEARRDLVRQWRLIPVPIWASLMPSVFSKSVTTDESQVERFSLFDPNVFSPSINKKDSVTKEDDRITRYSLTDYNIFTISPLFIEPTVTTTSIDPTNISTTTFT